MFERQKKRLECLKQNKSSRIEEIIVETIYIIFFILYNIFEAYLVYLIGKYSNKVIETIAIVIVFICNKSIYGKPLHFSNNFICLGVSFILFYVSIKCTVNINISLFTNVGIGVFDGAITSYIASYLYNENNKAKRRNLVQELVKLNLDKNKIQQICRDNGLNEDIGEIVYYRITHSQEEVCNKYYMDSSTINRKINKFIKVANK